MTEGPNQVVGICFCFLIMATGVKTTDSYIGSSKELSPETSKCFT